MTKTAIIAGAGGLPAELARAMTARGDAFAIFQIVGYPMDNPDGFATEDFQIERMALLFERMHAVGIEQVVFAGAISRPQLNPEAFDPQTAQLLPRILPLLQLGDDGLLRAVISLFEEAAFTIVGTVDLAPDLVPQPGVLTQAQPSEADQADTERGAAILNALGPLDVGQGAVIAGGQCLAIETQPGTQAMLQFVADTRRGQGGAFVKAPKPGQDRRIDLPAIGPDTVAQVAQAGLAGIVIEAGGVMVLDRANTVAAADAAGLFIWVRAS